MFVAFPPPSQINAFARDLEKSDPSRRISCLPAVATSIPLLNVCNIKKTWGISNHFNELDSWRKACKTVWTPLMFAISRCITLPCYCTVKLLMLYQSPLLSYSHNCFCIHSIKPEFMNLLFQVLLSSSILVQFIALLPQFLVSLKKHDNFFPGFCCFYIFRNNILSRFLDSWLRTILSILDHKLCAFRTYDYVHKEEVSFLNTCLNHNEMHWFQKKNWKLMRPRNYFNFPLVTGFWKFYMTIKLSGVSKLTPVHVWLVHIYWLNCNLF